MLGVLALSLQLCTTSVNVSDSPRSARLLAQYVPPPAGTPYVAPQYPTQEQQLQQQIDALTFRIRAVKTDFPAGSIVMAVLGFSASIALLPGLPMLFVGLALSGLTGSVIFLTIGIAFTIVGALGLAFGIYGVVSGNNAQQAARTERDELIRQREGLKQQLDVIQPQAPQYPGVPSSPQYPVPPGVQRELVTPHLVTAAVF